MGPSENSNLMRGVLWTSCSGISPSDSERELIATVDLDPCGT